VARRPFGHRCAVRRIHPPREAARRADRKRAALAAGTLAIVGPDKGGWARCDALAREYGIDIATRLEFVGLNEFTAAIAAADLVVVPSEKASQSGVLALAQQLRTPTVAADVGGMAELASDTFIAGDVDDLTRAIQARLASGASPVQPPIEEDHAVHAHLRAYGAPL
jgi:glycosyltransferase involved in cell wall biosynthesis